MYNHQLDTFLTVARTGSFSSAAEELYISPSAVNQQISSLEGNLKVPLFVRSRQGLHLTAAGEYLKSTAPDFIRHAQTMRERMESFDSKSFGAITVAIPHMHNIRLLYNIWGSYLLQNPGRQIQLVSSKSWEVEEVFRTYASCDLVEYVNIKAKWMTDRGFLQLSEVPISIAVPKQNPLSAFDRIPLQQLQKQTVATAIGAFSSAISQGIQQLENNGAKIQWEESYKNDLYDRCCLENKLILVLHSDYAVHSGFQIVPIEWNIALPYGFSYKKPCSPEMEAFLKFAEQWKDMQKNRE